MDKESIIQLQKIDCNCNDCLFMKRDFDTYNKWAKFHEGLQLDEFNRNKKLGHIREEAIFQFDKSSLLGYGVCSEFNKPVSFIPNVCQLETQNCFKHRRG